MITRRDFLSSSALAAAPLARSAAAQRSIVEQIRDGVALEGVDVIDTHAHFGRTSADLMWPLGVEMLLGDARRLGIGQTIVSHFDALMALSADQLKTAHDGCAAAVAKNPSHLRAYLVFHPHLLKTSQAEMQRVLEPGSPFAGFKLHGYIHRYPTDGANYQPVFEFADQHGLPVLLHTMRGLDGVGQICAKYPRMKLTLAHMGFLPDNLGALLKDCANLFVDTCGSTLQYRRLENLVRTAGAEKILFATDATYLSLGPQIAKIGFAEISDEEKRLILGGNARRIFGSRLAAKT